MLKSQKLTIELSEKRERLNVLLDKSELSSEEKEEREAITARLNELEPELRAAITAEGVEVTTNNTGEDAELRELKNRVSMGRYIGAAKQMRAVDGAELELNQHLNIDANHFPLELLSPAAEPEQRTTTAAESQQNQRTWLDRLFADSAASRLGITTVAVEAGVSSHPLTTAGASMSMEEKTDNVPDAAWTVGTTEAKPKRGAVRAVFSIEDTARMPGLEEALNRDIRMALMEGIDTAIFNGADGGSNNTADITGLNTAAITETTLTQANKIKGDKTLEAFANMIDGIHANGFSDLNVVAAVGAWRLWAQTVINSAADNQTLAQFLTASGLSYTSRGRIEAATTNGKFGAFVGRNRMINGAACACVWSNGELIRDPYSGAKSGEVALTLNYLWDFVIPRTASFQRIKFVT